MGRRKYPPLTPSEVVAIVGGLGFCFDRREGSHAHYERKATAGSGTGPAQRKVVTIDMSIREFDDFLIKSMIRQSGFTREEFYGATDKTRKKIEG